MNVVSTEDTEMDGLMMTFGSIGTQSVGGDCMLGGGEDITVTTVLGVQAPIGHGVVMVAGHGTVLMIHFITAGMVFMALTLIGMAIMETLRIGVIHLMVGLQYSLEKPITVLLPTNLEGQDDTD